MADNIVVGVPPSVVQLVQQGALQRYFHEGLFPNLGFRSEALLEEWPANSGTEHFMTRAGLITPVTEPLAPGSDPIPAETPYEQWSAKLDQFANAKDIHMPTSVVSNANLFLNEIKQMGLNAGQSVNRIARDRMFKAYLSGNTCTTQSRAGGETNVRVASLSGFNDVVTSITVRPAPVSPSTPLVVTVGTGGTAVTMSVIGTVPDNLNDPDGPGVLLFSSAITAQAVRAAVVSSAAPRIIRSSGSATVDGISASDTLNLQQVINAVGALRDNNVPPHDDGYYHAHISGAANAQFYQDPVFQRLNQSLPEGATYKDGFVGHISGVMFYMNTESPRFGNAGTQTTTYLLAQYAKGIGAEVTNATGVRIGRVIITGKGAIYERFLDESQYLTDAGVNGKVGEFSVTNGGLQIMTEKIRLILRAPMDRLQQKVGVAWSITTSFATPSDITAPSGPERYKRAIVLEHALAA